MLSVGFHFKVFAAIVSLVFALIVISRRPRSAAVGYLAAFFLLVAGNQGAEAMRLAATHPAAAEAWWRVATVFAALDPAILFYLVTIHPHRHPSNRLRFVVPVWLVGAGLALAVGFTSLTSAGPDSSHVHSTVLVIYTAVLYFAVVLIAVGRAAREVEAFWRLFLPAAILTSLPVVAQVPYYLLAAAETLRGGNKFVFEPWLAITQAVFLIGGTGIILARAIRVWPSGRRYVSVALAAAFILTLILNVRQIAFNLVDSFQFDIDYARLHPVGQAAASVRWLAFGMLASGALLRGDVLDMGLALRRRAARILIGLFLVGFVGLLALIVMGVRGEFSEAMLIIATGIVATLAISRGARDALTHLAHRVYGVPPPGALRHRQATYLSAFENAEAREDQVVARAELLRLRADLELDAGVITNLERVAKDAPAWDPRPGTLVGTHYRIFSLGPRSATGRLFLAEDERDQQVVQMIEVRDEGNRGFADQLRALRVVTELNHPSILRPIAIIPCAVGVLVVQAPPPRPIGAHESPPRAWSPREVAHFIDTLLAAMDVVHDHGLVHGGLSGEVVSILPDGSAGITGWGHPRGAASRTVQLKRGYRSTPAPHVAPETLIGPPIPATDLFAVGVIAREILPSPLSPRIEAVLRRAEAADPTHRWPSAEAMRIAWAQATRDDGDPEPS